MRRVAVLFLITALFHLLPIWRVHFVPTVDGPSHLYNAQVLHELANGTPEFTRVFRADLRPFPNWLGHVLLFLALGIAPPLIAEKLVLSTIVLVFLGGCWKLAGVIDPRSRVYAFLVMPLAYSLLLQMGFYNYFLGVGLAMFAVAASWERRTALTGTVLLLCYFAHAIPAMVALLMIAVIWIVRREWRNWTALLTTLPTIALLTWFALQPKPPGGDWTWSGALVWQPLLRVMLLLTFDMRQLTFGTVLGGVMLLLIAVTIAVENVDWKRRRVSISERDAFLLLTLMATAIYLAAPLGVQEGFVLKARLVIFPYLLLLPWLTPRLGRGSVALLLAAVAILNVLFIRDAWKRNDKLIAEAVRPLVLAAPLKTIVPLIFDRSSPVSIHPLFSHAPSYGFIDRRLIDLGDYEAALGFFPVAYRPDVVRPAIIDIETAPGNFDPNRWNADYIYTWKMPAGAPLESRLSAAYERVAGDGNARLDARKAK
ncbi:MAG TPA: hypothetical protein VGQ46_05080 [Thermoanaerobaculia bacterium]|jgi:hypothetical protein|nr:hypothetical protein [Thermoanaerobaculia bacterium]